MNDLNQAITVPIQKMLTHIGLSPYVASVLDTLIVALLLFAVAYLLDRLASSFLTKRFYSLAKKTKTIWDDKVVEMGLINRLVHILVAVAVWQILPLLFPARLNFMESLLLKLTYIFFIALSARFLSAFFSYLNEYTNSNDQLKDHPLKGLFQVLKIVVYFIATILILAKIIDQNPTMLFTSLGAVAAVLILVFKDTLLGFVAGIQLSANDMLRKGDWISVPKYNADGMVVDISINTVKIRNWDNTISMVPPYALVSDSFQNWRGMSESGARRIKRSISIDMRSVQFCSSEMLERYRQIELVSSYIDKKQAEIEQYKASLMPEGDYMGPRSQTNLGIFRAYLTTYLRNKPEVSKQLTCMVRQLQPSEKGIPIEVYFFSSVIQWVQYESIQADVFDHILAVIPLFDLQVYQDFSGGDIQKTLEYTRVLK